MLLQGWQGVGNILQALQLQQLLQGKPGLAPQQHNEAQLNNLNMLLPSLTNARQVQHSTVSVY